MRTHISARTLRSDAVPPRTVPQTYSYTEMTRRVFYVAGGGPIGPVVTVFLLLSDIAILFFFITLKRHFKSSLFKLSQRNSLPLCKPILGLRGS